MNILYIHQYFKTPSEPGGTRSYWMAKELIKNGHHVTMLTTSSEIKAGVQNVITDGINIIYLKVPYDQNMTIIRRLVSFIHFMIKSTVHALKLKKMNLVIATSTPLTIGFPALILKFFKKTPYIFEVRDLWPEVPIQMGALKNPAIKKLAYYFEKVVYKNANHIIALSPGMVEGVRRRKVSDRRISMIPNMAKIDAFWPREKNTKLASELGLKENTFKIIHFGSLGIANGIATILESAKLLINNQQVEFIFIGGGSSENDLIKECKSSGLNNVHFLGKFSMKKTSEIVNLCDVSIVSFLDIPILYTNSPNKLFDSLSAGKPVIVNSAGWTKELVETNECGAYVDPNYPEQLSTTILSWIGQGEKLLQMGKNARKLAETTYDKSILCKKFVDIIERTC